MPSNKNILNIDLLGPFGSGKGTQAEYLIKDFDLRHFVMGEALKREIKEGTKLGKEIEPIVRAGDLVGDAVIKVILERFLKEVDPGLGLIFDGLPRNLDQKKIFDELIEQYDREPIYLFIDISPETSLRRLSQRKICQKCGDKPVGISFSEKACKACGGEIVVRYDDKPEIIKHRMKVYEKEVKPVIDQYQAGGRMFRINGEQTPLEVHKEIMDVLKNQGYIGNELHKD